MKRTFSTIIPTIALAALCAVGGCDRGSSGLKSSTRSAEKTSFDQVASHLDAGGNLYLYLSTEQLLEGLATKVGAWQDLVSSIPNLKVSPGDIGRIFGVVTNLIRDSGIEDVSGFGVSGIAVEPGFYRTKSFLHHYSGKGNGLLWKVGGEKAHALKSLDMLPVNTAFAMFSDLDVRMLWSFIEKHVRDSGFPQADEFLDKLPAEFRKGTGLEWNKVIGSMGGEFGFVLTLDDTRMIPIPVPTTSKLEIPEPGILLAVKVTDDTIFNRIEQALKDTKQNVIEVNEPKLKMRTVPVPLPLPIQLRPTLAASEGYLFIASSDTLLQQFMAVKAGKSPGLKSTDEFKRLAKGVPEEGNSFCFLSQRFGKTIVEIQQHALEMAAQGNQARGEFLEGLLSRQPAAFSYSVSANTDEGWLSVANGNQHPAAIMAAAAVVPAVIAAVALPALARAKQAAQRNAPPQ